MSMSIWDHTRLCLFFLIFVDGLFWMIAGLLLYHFVFR